MEHLITKTNSAATVMSWFILLFGWACLATLAWYVPWSRQNYMAFFADFHTELPGATKLALSIPTALFPSAAILLALTMAWVQWRAHSKSNAALYHMLVIVLCCVSVVAYQESMAGPMWSILRAVSSPAHR